MKWLKVGAVIFGAVAITALGIDAADTLTGSRSTLLGQLASTGEGGCPSGMISVQTGATFSCADVYEASVSDSCPVKSPTNAQQTKQNVDDSSCGAVSVKDAEPWKFVTRDQAELACARSGKRLPNNEEWQIVSAGTPDDDAVCNVSSNGARPAGANALCASAAGVVDAVGNLWEWTNEDVFDGNFNGRALPPEGYVLQVDRGGVAVLTGENSSDLFGEDYFWSSNSGAFGIMRGGFYGSREDAGVYTTHAATPPTFAGAAIGFRCVM